MPLPCKNRDRPHEYFDYLVITIESNGRSREEDDLHRQMMWSIMTQRTDLLLLVHDESPDYLHGVKVRWLPTTTAVLLLKPSSKPMVDIKCVAVPTLGRLHRTLAREIMSMT